MQQTKTHLFPSTGLAAVIEQFLGGRDRTFDDLVVPFTAVAMDVATGRAHPIRHGPLLPALLASAAVPGIYPRVDHDGRRLYDGGIVANVPMRIAVDMGARSLVVLDCAFPSQLPILGETFAEIVLFTALVAMRTQAVYEAPLVAEDIPVVYLPGPAPRARLATRLLALRRADRSVLRSRSNVPGITHDHRSGPLRIACGVIRARPGEVASNPTNLSVRIRVEGGAHHPDLGNAAFAARASGEAFTSRKRRDSRRRPSSNGRRRPSMTARFAANTAAAGLRVIAPHCGALIAEFLHP